MKVEEDEFEENEVYAVDIVVSTGEGKAKVKDEKETTVYKRALDMEYNLKMKVRRAAARPGCTGFLPGGQTWLGCALLGSTCGL